VSQPAAARCVLGGRLVMEENPCIVRLANCWDRRAEIRCSMRHPDGYLIGVGQATGPGEGRLAEQGAAGSDRECAHWSRSITMPRDCWQAAW
jgi:hypothetical protein